MAEKLTLKNIMVFDYVRRKGGGNVKKIFTENQAEIKKLFNIKTYNSFNRHITKVIKFEESNPLRRAIER